MADEVALAAGATLLAHCSGADHLFDFDCRFLRFVWAPVFSELHRICGLRHRPFQRKVYVVVAESTTFVSFTAPQSCD